MEVTLGAGGGVSRNISRSVRTSSLWEEQAETSIRVAKAKHVPKIIVRFMIHFSSMGTSKLNDDRFARRVCV